MWRDYSYGSAFINLSTWLFISVFINISLRSNYPLINAIIILLNTNRKMIPVYLFYASHNQITPYLSMNYIFMNILFNKIEIAVHYLHQKALHKYFHCCFRYVPRNGSFQCSSSEYLPDLII